DIMLPDMDGWEFLSLIKQIPELQRIPVVIVSIVADATRGFSLGAAAVMQKPISRKELCDSLADVGLLPVSRLKTLKVLLVDDDPGAVEQLALDVEGVASTVLRAYGGREAVEVALRELPDVIVLALMMPDMNGFDVVTALVAHPDTAHIPLLVVTSKEITAEDRARLNGFVSAIVQKGSFSPERIRDEVRRAMAGRRLVA
ncbi:MAG TPA: response regulator, partial [Longimicrobiales bacterium]